MGKVTPVGVAASQSISVFPPDVFPPSVFPPVGFVRREGAAAFFGINLDSLARWTAIGRVGFGRRVGKPAGGKCTIYAVADLERLREALAAAVCLC